ncbi:4Fe-4S ferredoxin, partial [Desulfocurvibacter africanus]
MQTRRAPGRSGPARPRNKRLRLPRPRAQRLVQALSLTLFLGLLAAAFANLASTVAENLFWRLDPLVA